jgi:hypothetical protein
MRIDSSFQPDESCIALTITRGAWRTDFTNTRKAATQHLHFRGAAIILVPDRSLGGRPQIDRSTHNQMVTWLEERRRPPDRKR